MSMPAQQKGRFAQYRRVRRPGRPWTGHAGVSREQFLHRQHVYRLHLRRGQHRRLQRTHGARRSDRYPELDVPSVPIKVMLFSAFRPMIRPVRLIRSIDLQWPNHQQPHLRRLGGRSPDCLGCLLQSVLQRRDGHPQHGQHGLDEVQSLTLTNPVPVETIQKTPTLSSGGTISNGTTYYYEITALFPNGESLPGNEQSITTYRRQPGDQLVVDSGCRGHGLQYLPHEHFRKLWP